MLIRDEDVRAADRTPFRLLEDVPALNAGEWPEIPIDLLNPGQVFACLGLMEAAEQLLGEAEARLEAPGSRRSRSGRVGAIDRRWQCGSSVPPELSLTLPREGLRFRRALIESGAQLLKRIVVRPSTRETMSTA